MNRRNFLTGATVAAGFLAVDAERAVAGHEKARSTATGMPMPFIETRDHAALFYKDWGTGKPVLFVHSWAANSELWQYQMIHLSDQGMRCVAYDTRGHGRSSDPGRGYDADTLADDLAAVIQKLDLHEVTLVGHSMGCGEIVRYLSRHGASRISRVVFVSPTTPFSLKTADNPDGIDRSSLDHLREIWTKDFPKWLGDNARPFFSPETSPEMVQWGVRMCLQASLKAIIECNRVDSETDYRTELTKINRPTLIIHGDADASAHIERTGRRTAKLIPGSQFRVYEGAPHGLMFTHRERLNADLLAFMKE